MSRDCSLCTGEWFRKSQLDDMYACRQVGENHLSSEWTATDMDSAPTSVGLKVSAPRTSLNRWWGTSYPKRQRVFHFSTELEPSTRPDAWWGQVCKWGCSNQSPIVTLCGRVCAIGLWWEQYKLEPTFTLRCARAARGTAAGGVVVLYPTDAGS